MNILFLLIILFLLLFDICVLRRNMKLFNRKIRQENKILFYKLQKQYLNNTTTEDIKDLMSFLYQYIERGRYNESKKSRKKV